VTGGSNGFGRSIVLNLLEQNHFVISLSRSLLPKEVTEMYQATFFQSKVDFSKSFSVRAKKSLKKMTDQINLKNIDQVFLINNAAIINPIGRIEKFKEKEIVSQIQINLISPILMSQIFLEKFFKFKGFKTIVQITSGAAVNPVEGWALYCSSKAGLNMFNQVLSLQNQQDKKFRAIGYSPGIMDTNMQKNIRAVSKSQFPQIEDFKRYKSENQLRGPDYVAQHLLRLLKDPMQLTSGHIYRVS
jgi:benzil reductase ((S)-benzoin forming)